MKYRYLSAVSGALTQIQLGPPIELTATAGDIFFHHYLGVTPLIAELTQYLPLDMVPLTSMAYIPVSSS